MTRAFTLFFLMFTLPVFGYNFKDICRDVAPSDKASIAVLNVLQSLEKIEVDGDVKGLMAFLRSGLDTESFYLGDLYRSDYFKPIGNDYRALTLKHVRNPGFNQIQVTSELYDDIDVKGGDNYIGVQEFGIKMNIFATLKKYASYSVYFRSKESWENAGDIDIAAAVNGLMKIVDPENIRQIKSLSCPLHENLKDESRVLMDDFSSTFPNVSSLIDRYVEFNQFLTIAQAGDIQYTHMELEPKLKRRVLKKDYPDLAEYLDKYRKVVEMRMVLRNEEGNAFTIINIIPRKILIECYTRQGKVIPFTDDGRLIFEDARTFETQKNITVDTNLHIDFLGLNLNIDGTSHMEHLCTRERELINAKVASLDYTYSGMLLGFIPMSVIKFLSPIDIDKFADDMIHVMLNADNGKGTRVNLLWEVDEENNRYSTVNVSTEMLDHFAVRFFTRYSHLLVGSNDKAMDQSRELAGKMLSAILVDAEAIYANTNTNHPPVAATEQPHIED